MSYGANKLILRRIIAGILDYFVFLLILLIYIRVIGIYSVDAAGNQNFMIIGWKHFFIFFLIWLILLPLLEGILGYTFGKGILDLHVKTDDGQKTNIGLSLFRHCFDIFDVFTIIVLLILTFIKEIEKPKRIGDWLTDTFVIYQKEINEKNNKKPAAS